MKELFDSLSDEEIHKSLTEYAASPDRRGNRNIKEFVAEGFAESFYSDARPMGKKIRSLIDEIISEAKP
jgi:hypothetical protein